MNKKYIVLVLTLAALFGLIVYGSLTDSSMDNPDEQASVTVPELNKLSLSVFDLDIDPSKAVTIDLDSYEGDVLKISSGDHILSGTLNGSVYVSASEEKVHLFLDNVSITSKGGPALIVENADKVVITLVAGSENFIGDNGIYDLSKEYDACIDSDPSITINGTGSLKISGLFKDGLHTKDVLKIVDCDIKTECKRNSFQGNDGILIKDSSLFVESEKNGFKTTKSDASDRGYIVVDGSKMSIISGRVSFISKSDLYIVDSDIVHRSIVSLSEVAGRSYIQEGCVR